MNRPTVQLSVYSDMLKGPATHLVAGSGQIVHIWGASGAGKSTLLSRIWGSRSMGGGQLRVEIDGTTLDLAGMPAARLAFVRPRLMTYVEQRPTVLGLIGAGGIGQLLFESIQAFDYRQVSAIAIVIVVAVTLIDMLSQAMRKRLL